MNPELETIKAVLMKSYDGLPYYLKACFLYLAIFPEDEQIARRRLVRRWIAEGYSGEVRGKSVEEVLDSYFMELISRSMILPSQLSIYSRKGTDSCHVHDLIREIAISKSMEENLVFTLEEGCSLNNQGTVRHLAVSSNWKGDQCEFENVVDLSRLRSLTVFGNWKQFYISDKMRLLRVLDLEGEWDLADQDLQHIGRLVHLIYLSLRGHAAIRHLPNSLGNLRQLQTLDISGTSIIRLPRTIIKLVKMQHMCGCGIQRNPGGVELPRGIWKLKALHTLRTMDVSVGKVLKDIKKLIRLRKLGLTGINKRNSQELCSAIACLSSLESLSLRSDSDEGLSGCLDDLSSPSENLQSLKLIGNLVILPTWVQGLKNLVKLKLERSRISEHDTAIHVLGSLPNLAILCLLDYSFVGKVVCLTFCREAFPSLKVLQLHWVRNNESVKFEGGAAPKLESLQYLGSRCPSVGLFCGLPNPASLKEFMLHRAWWKTELVEHLRGQFPEDWE